MDAFGGAIILFILYLFIAKIEDGGDIDGF